MSRKDGRTVFSPVGNQLRLCSADHLVDPPGDQPRFALGRRQFLFIIRIAGTGILAVFSHIFRFCVLAVFISGTSGGAVPVDQMDFHGRGCI